MIGPFLADLTFLGVLMNFERELTHAGQSLAMQTYSYHGRLSIDPIKSRVYILAREII